MKNKISTALLGTALSLAMAGVAMAQDKTVKIGALSDQSVSMPISAARARPWLRRWRRRTPV